VTSLGLKLTVRFVELDRVGRERLGREQRGVDKGGLSTEAE
jgi:hypothetical protein